MPRAFFSRPLIAVSGIWTAHEILVHDIDYTGSYIEYSCFIEFIKQVEEKR